MKLYLCNGTPIYTIRIGSLLHIRYNILINQSMAPYTRIPVKTLLNFPCNFCEKMYKSKSTRNKHDKAVHFNIRLNCLLCTKSYSQKFKVRNHFRTAYLGERDSLCPYCDRSSSLKTNPTQHIKCMHNNE